MQYKELREKYPKFVYEKYSYRISGNPRTRAFGSVRGRNLEIFFNFKIEPNIYFQPKIIIENLNASQIKKVGVDSPGVLNNLVFHLGLMEIPSYWKATCSPEILIKAGPLSMKASPSSPSSTNLRFVSINKEQIDWWKDLIIKGMGQFFYENKINFTHPNFFKIISPTPEQNWSRTVLDQSNDKVLVPVGGGKDSVVTLELLKKAGKQIRCFSLNPTEAALKIMKLAGCKRPLIVRREIDEKLLELNRQGFLNGHTPFSAYLAFLSVLVATIFGQRYIAFSNERSSNEGNVKYLGKVINHQWSKSFEFEQKFRKYSKKYLTPSPKFGGGLEYFSFLRPLYEIQIAKLFSKYPKYFNAFLSCNVAYQTVSGTKLPAKKWCGNCSKCLFVFTILYPFVEEKKLIKIWGRNLFENKNLLPIMQELIGERKFKPFECVGTEKESLIAFYLSWKKAKSGQELFLTKLPFLLRYFEEKIMPKYLNLEKESKKLMSSWNAQNNSPKDFEKILKTSLL